MKEAILYLKKEKKAVSCLLCSHYCTIADGKTGICSVRENKDGVLYTHSYGNLISTNIDPIEKKPLFHFMPGSVSYSIAAIGCNFRCGFCQNWEISQKKEAEKLGVKSYYLSPDQIVAEAKRYGCKSISYTYTEPTIFFEYALDIARTAKEQGICNVFVTNGYMTRDCLDVSRGLFDAANVDLKSFRDEFYKNLCGAHLKPVLDSIEYMKRIKLWVEVTTLIVPGFNDSDEELKGIASFLAGISKDIPWHISRFHPQYKMNDLMPTPVLTLEKAQRIGLEAGLRYVYIGNVQGEGEDTICHNCSEHLIVRSGYVVKKNIIKEGKCQKCKASIEGVWK